MAKFFQVVDNQGCSFMDYTRAEDWTAEDIRVHLRDQQNDQHWGGMLPEDIPLNELLSIFDLSIELEERTAVRTSDGQRVRVEVAE